MIFWTRSPWPVNREFPHFPLKICQQTGTAERNLTRSRLRGVWWFVESRKPQRPRRPRRSLSSLRPRSSGPGRSPKRTMARSSLGICPSVVSRPQAPVQANLRLPLLPQSEQPNQSRRLCSRRPRVPALRIRCLRNRVRRFLHPQPLFMRLRPLWYSPTGQSLSVARMPTGIPWSLVHRLLGITVLLHNPCPVEPIIRGVGSVRLHG